MYVNKMFTEHHGTVMLKPVFQAQGPMSSSGMVVTSQPLVTEWLAAAAVVAAQIH